MAEPLETIHVYIVKEEEEQPLVDSTVHDPAETVTQPLVQQLQQRYSLLAPLLVLGVNIGVVIAVFFIHIYPILTATATITIIPKRALFTTSLTLSNVQSRVFSPVTETQSKTVPATGKGHQDAIQATGTITLFNAATSEQTIDAGTLFIGNDGAHIITDQIAYIPGATPPLEGQVTVSAHAVNPGAAGNIQPGDIQGACCRENIFAYSSAFLGGQDARDYTVVRQEDIHTVVSSVMPYLTEHIHAAFQQQIQPGETLTPHQCSQNIVTDRNAGDEATNVTVTVSESCTAAAYNRHSLQMQATNAFLQSALPHTGTGYILQSFHPTVRSAVIQKDHLLFTVLCQGDLIYHLSPQELQQLRGALAGKTRKQGIAMLSHLNGIEHITIQLGKNGKFPTDPTHINILFLIVS